MNEAPSAKPRRGFFKRNHDAAPTTRYIGISAPWALILGSIAVLTVSQFIRKDVPREFTLIPLLMIPISLVLFYLGIRAVDRGRLPVWIGNFLQKAADWLGITAGQVFCLLFSLFFSLLTPVAAGYAARMFAPQAAVVCWVCGILLAVYGGSSAFIKHQKLSTIAIATGLILFTAALLLRAINTEFIPAVLTGDEASSGLFSTNFLTGSLNNIFISGWFSFPTLHNLIQSISILLFGQTTQALRLLSAFSGALTVALVFYVGRSMFGWVAGLAAAIFLSGMHFHIHFSRIGLNNIWDGFFLTLTLGFLWIGWQQYRRAAYLAAGLGLGLAQYFYTTGRILFLIIPLWLLAAGLSDRTRLRRSVPGLLLLFWVAFIVVLPLGWFYLNHPDEFMAPLNRVSIMGSWLKEAFAQTGRPPFLILLNQLWQGFLGYFAIPLRAWYMPGVPMLRTLPGIAFLLGLVFMVLRPKDSRNQLIFIWLLALSITVGMSESTPAAQRYVAAAPAAALMVAFSLKSLGNLLARRWPERIKWIGIGIVAISLLLSADDARFYFYKYTPRSDFGGFNGRVAQTLALRLQSEPAGQELVFCGYPNMGYDSISSLPYLAPQIKYYNVNLPWGSIEDPQPEGKRILFAFLPDHANDQAAVQKEYPGGSWSSYYSDTGTLLFQLYDVQHP